MSYGRQPVGEGRQFRANYILAGALIAGALVFGVIVMVLRPMLRPPDPQVSTMLAYIGLGVGAAHIIALGIFPDRIVRERLKQISNEVAPKQQLHVAYRTKLVIGMSLLEGAAFLNLVLYMRGADWWCLAAAGVLVLMMAGAFPTRTKVEHWIETHWQLVELDR